MFLQENNTLTGHIIRYTLLVPPWPCTGSVREGSLGETHICVGPRGQLCASASVQRVPSDREKNNWQWDVSGEANRSTWASPKRLQISWSTSGWSRHSPGRVGWRESSSAARLSLPGTWTAWSDLRCFWLQRRRCPSRDPVMKLTLKQYHMKQSEWRDSGCGYHMPQEPLKVFQWNRPLALERLQAAQHWLSKFYWETCCEVDRVQLHAEKRDPLRRGEFALFPVDLKPQPAEVTEHRIPVFAQQCSRLGQ